MSTRASTASGRPALNTLDRPRTSTAFDPSARGVGHSVTSRGRLRIPTRSISATIPAISKPERGRAEHRREHLGRVARRLAGVLDDQPADAARQTRGDLRDHDADHRGGRRQLERGDDVGHRRGEPEFHQRLAPRRCVRVHELQGRGRRRRQALQRTDGDREERQEGAQHRGREPPRPFEGSDVELAAPADHQRRERDQRNGLRQHQVRQEPPLDDLVASHQDRQAQPDDRAERETGERDPEREPGPLQDDHRDGGRRCPVLGLPVAREHLPHVRHRRVVRARQDRPAEDGAAVLRPDHLVELPDGGDQHAARARTSRRRRARVKTSRGPCRRWPG